MLLLVIVAVVLAIFEWLYHPGVAAARRTARACSSGRWWPSPSCSAAGEGADQVLLSKPDQPRRLVFNAPDIAVVGFADEQGRPTSVPSGVIGSGRTEAVGAQLQCLTR